MSMGIRRHKTAPSWSGDILGISWDRLISPNKLWGATPFRHLICVYIGEKNHLWWTDDSKPNPLGQKWRARSKVGYLSSFIHAFTQNGSEICRLLRVTSLSTTNEPVGKGHFCPQTLVLWKAFQKWNTNYRQLLLSLVLYPQNTGYFLANASRISWAIGLQST